MPQWGMKYWHKGIDPCNTLLWNEEMDIRPDFSKEVEQPSPLYELMENLQSVLHVLHRTMQDASSVRPLMPWDGISAKQILPELSICFITHWEEN